MVFLIVICIDPTQLAVNTWTSKATEDKPTLKLTVFSYSLSEQIISKICHLESTCTLGVIHSSYEILKYAKQDTVKWRDHLK